MFDQFESNSYNKSFETRILETLEMYVDTIDEFEYTLWWNFLPTEETTRVKPYDTLPSSRSSETRQLHSDRRRKKRRRKQPQPQPWSNEQENLINLGGHSRGKKKQQQLLSPGSTSASSVKKARGRWGKYREERRRRRRNRKRARTRMRLENRREENKWRDNPLGRLLKVLNEQKADEARMLSENPLNLSSPSFDKEAEMGWLNFNQTMSLLFPFDFLMKNFSKTVFSQTSFNS